MDKGASYHNLKQMMPTQEFIISYIRTSQCALSLLYGGHFANGEAGGGALKRQGLKQSVSDGGGVECRRTGQDEKTNVFVEHWRM